MKPLQLLGLDVVYSADEMVRGGGGVFRGRQGGDGDIHVVEGRVEEAGAAGVEERTAEGREEREGLGLSHARP